jgi:hypothetical protein
MICNSDFTNKEGLKTTFWSLCGIHSRELIFGKN